MRRPAPRGRAGRQGPRQPATIAATASTRGSMLTPAAANGPTASNRRSTRERDPRRRDRGRHDEQQALEERHPGHVARAGAARAQQRRLDPSLLDQQPRDEHQGVGGQHRELDGEHHHAGAADQQRPIGPLEHRWQPGRDAEECRVAEIGLDAALEGGRVAPHPPHVLEREVLERGQRPPRHVEVARRDARDEILTRHDHRPVDVEGRRPASRR